MKIKTNYNKCRDGYYVGFDEGGIAYDHNKLIKLDSNTLKLFKKTSHPTIIHKFKASDRISYIAHIEYTLKVKSLQLLFLGTDYGEYDHTIYGWATIYREKKNVPVLIYSLEEVLIELQKDMNWHNAFEYWEFNMNGSWMGTHTPIYHYKNSDYSSFLNNSEFQDDK